MLNKVPAPPPVEDDPEQGSDVRPPWHWIGFGTVAIFAVWLPLAYAAQAITTRVISSRFGAAPSRAELDVAMQAMSTSERFRWSATLSLPHVLAFAIAAFAGGLLVGRFGAGARVREATLSGVTTSLFALGLSWRVLLEGGATALLTALVMAGLATAFATWGGRVGVGKRTG